MATCGHGACLCDAAGVVAGTRAYAGFGAIVSASGSGLDRYAYTGREWDSGLGLQYSRARLYDPASGRFLAEDPIGSGGRDPNLHRYVGNSPTNLTDPSGLQPPARSLQDRFYDGFGVARPGDIARAAAGHVRGRVRGLLGPAAAAAYNVDGVMAGGTPVGRVIDNAGVAAEVSLAGAFLAYDQFFGEDTNLDAVGEPGLVLSFVPVYGSGRTAVNAWQNGRYGSAVVNGAFAVLDVSVVTALVRGAVRNGLFRGGARLADDAVGAAGRAELTTGRRLPACDAPRGGHLPDAMATPGGPRRLAAFELEDLHGHRLAELNDTAARVMNRLGVPRELRGIEEQGRQAINRTGQPFTFETAQGGRNTLPGRNPRLEEAGHLRVTRRGINVDAAVLDDNFLPSATWRNATVEQRMEAIVAHELAEYGSPGLTFSWRHAEAMMRSYRNPHISDQARAIIGDQIRHAIGGHDGQITQALLPRIRQALESSAERSDLPR